MDASGPDRGSIWRGMVTAEDSGPEAEKKTVKVRDRAVSAQMMRGSPPSKGFMFKSLTHFELIFVYGERQWSSFLIYGKDSPSPIMYSLFFSGKLIISRFISGLAILFHSSMCFCANITLF